jgi:hypothetical protein
MASLHARALSGKERIEESLQWLANQQREFRDILSFLRKQQSELKSKRGLVTRVATRAVEERYASLRSENLARIRRIQCTLSRIAVDIRLEEEARDFHGHMLEQFIPETHRG